MGEVQAEGILRMANTLEDLTSFTVVHEPKAPLSVDNLRWCADELRGQAIMATPGAWDDGEFPEMRIDWDMIREIGGIGGISARRAMVASKDGRAGTSRVCRGGERAEDDSRDATTSPAGNPAPGDRISSPGCPPPE